MFRRGLDFVLISVILFGVWFLCVYGAPVRGGNKHLPPGKKNNKGGTKGKGNAYGKDPDKFLEKFGYLPRRRPGVQFSPADKKKGIKNFQRMYNLRVTGTMTEETEEMMSAPRCGMLDVIPQMSALDNLTMFDPYDAQATNFYVPGYKWGQDQLTWRSVNYSPDMSEGAQRRAFYKAFELWSQVAPLDFIETGSGTPDIEILFGHGYHGDSPGNEFDGEGGILAHAYYPENGDTHFDEAETWTEFTDEGMNLMIVAAHEFGHALGLGHSNVPGALMAPYYQGYEANFKLREDDINALQSLYGRRVTLPPTTPAPTTPVPTQPPEQTTPTPWPGSTLNPCTTKFDAILQAHDSRIYVFREEWIMALTDVGIEDGYPRLTSDVFENPPINIGAAVYSWMTRYSFFFKGNRVWKYYGFSLIELKEIETPGYPSKIGAALMGRDGRIYILSGADYYIFDEWTMDIYPDGPRPISGMWNGIPVDTEAAIRLRDGTLYFFKGFKYRKYDEANRQVPSDYPKYIAKPWMGSRCGGYEPR